MTTSRERARAWLDARTDAYDIGHWRTKEVTDTLTAEFEKVRAEAIEECAVLAEEPTERSSPYLARRDIVGRIRALADTKGGE
jgi:hypothetical protein